ncbi:MAG: hypothetical protein U0517_00880 [Candidatus Andersenbacteria bacterium]
MSRRSRAMVFCLIAQLSNMIGQAGENPLKSLEIKYERHKLRENREEGAEHDIDCTIRKRAEGAYCVVHETTDPTRCPTLAHGNWKGDAWTTCVPTIDDKGFAYCAEHDLYTCYLLRYWSPESDSDSAIDHAPAECKKVNRDGRPYCAKHDTFACFTPRLVCRLHPGKLCGVVRAGSRESPGMVLVEDGEESKQIPVLSLLAPNAATRHTAYIWVEPR